MLYNQPLISSTSKYVSQKYDTPKTIGKKWQIDVKYIVIDMYSPYVSLIKKCFQMLK